MKKSYTYAALAAVLVVAGGAGYFVLDRSQSPLSAITGAQNIEIKPTDMVHGSAKAPVTFVEYASMTCPHCAAFQKEVIPLLTKDYVDPGKVKVVFREYPLDGAARMAS
ncbi:MAG TPA: thioredoxin domain-containing protein, partial [Micropepsaceae bacterium]|nr:thioredoxin domain-containing protein [Micropepsaceae bacterium]